MIRTPTALILTAMCALGAAPAAAFAQPTTRVSTNAAGQEVSGFAGAFSPIISPDARYVVFTSAAANLMPGGNHGPELFQVFRKDLNAGNLDLVSVGPGGVKGDGVSGLGISMSSDGTLIAFGSTANNLITGDTNAVSDVFVHDMIAGTTTRVSVGVGGIQGDALAADPSISSNGRYVAFASDAGNLGVPGGAFYGSKILVYDRQTGTVTHESIGVGGTQPQGGGSHFPSISGDGRYVVFSSDANNLVAGDTNSAQDLFLRDRTSGTTTRIALNVAGSTNGHCQASISSDGRRIAFTKVSGAGHRDAYIYDRIAGTTTLVSGGVTNGAGGHDCDHAAMISSNGLFVTFACHTLPNGNGGGPWETYFNNYLGQALAQASVHNAGGGNGEGGGDIGGIPDSGWMLVFDSDADDLVAGDTNHESDIFLRDFWMGETSRPVLAADGSNPSSIAGSAGVSLSADGRMAAFLSNADLTGGDGNFTWDAFIKDLSSGQVTRVSVSATGGDADVGISVNTQSPFPRISADGSAVAFTSESTNLVAGDVNRVSDVFVRDLASAQTKLISKSSAGVQGNAASYQPAISANGQVIAFVSAADNLVAGDTNSRNDIFVRVRNPNGSGTTERVSVSTSGAQANGDCDLPAISGDGRFVAFSSYAGNLVAGDTNGEEDIFVRDRQTAQTTRVSVGPGGAQADGHSEQPSISADGRYVAFLSDADNLVPGDTNNRADAFVRDLVAGTTIRVSVASDGTQANEDSDNPQISPDGRFVMFACGANNLVPGDTNGASDYFLHEIATGQTTRLSVTTSGAQCHEPSYGEAFGGMSADASRVIFSSRAPDLVPGDANNQFDVFTRDLVTTPPPCPADVDDGSGTGTPDGGVTIDDLLYYLILFANGDVAGDLDDGSGTGTPDGGVTIDDLLYFLVHFAQGC